MLDRAEARLIEYVVRNRGGKVRFTKDNRPVVLMGTVNGMSRMRVVSIYMVGEDIVADLEGDGTIYGNIRVVDGWNRAIVTAL